MASEQRLKPILTVEHYTSLPLGTLLRTYLDTVVYCSLQHVKVGEEKHRQRLFESSRGRGPSAPSAPSRW